MRPAEPHWFQNKARILFAGSGLVLLMLPLHLALSEEASVQTAALTLAVIAGAYIGFGARDGRMSAFAAEFVAAAGFAVAALLGLLLSKWIIPAAIALHAVWDLAHHKPGPLAHTPHWYVPFCIWIDVLAAAAISVVFLLK